MKQSGRWGWVIGLALASAACVGSEVTYIGKAKYPAKPEGCAIEVFPSTTPDQEWEDLATVESRCHHWFGRSSCIEHLKKQACKLGGDSIYGLKDGKQGEENIVIATVGRRKDGAAQLAKQGGPPRPGAAAPDTGAKRSCDPPCSPGYACAEGECIAVCNPECGEGMRCNSKRTCEPVAEGSP